MSDKSTHIKACIFDLDGVIVDTAHYHYLAWKSLAKQLGIDFTPENNELLKGVSRMESLNILLGLGTMHFSDEEKLMLAETKNRNYLGYIQKMTPDEVLPGVWDFLTELKKAGIRTGLGSVSKNAPLILEKIKMENTFDAVVDGNVVSRAKPHPEVFETCAKFLDVAPDECVVFEDAVAGVEAAHNAGMRCVGVGSPNILKEADRVIGGFKDLHLKDIDFKGLQ